MLVKTERGDGPFRSGDAGVQLSVMMGPGDGAGEWGACDMDWRCSILVLVLLQWVATVVLEGCGRVWGARGF